MRVLLASASPRRKEILSQIISKFEIESYDIDENFVGEDPEDTVLQIAKRKLKAVKEKDKYQIIITCDTLVYLDDKYYGKPSSRAEALRMLRELSGKTHKVISGLVVFFEGETIERAVTSEVTFKRLSSEDINFYLDNFSFSDKAGAYAIQDEFLVEKFSGSYYNVVGLPKEELEKIMLMIVNEGQKNEK